MISVKEVPSETHSTIPRMSEVHPMNETMRSFWPYIPRVAKGKMGRMANTGDKNKRMVYVCRLCVWYVVDYGWRVRRLTLGAESNVNINGRLCCWWGCTDSCLFFVESSHRLSSISVL
eukprot:scaffold7117_cov199-Alexandrium_tamarense.AAC.9